MNFRQPGFPGDCPGNDLPDFTLIAHVPVQVAAPPPDQGIYGVMPFPRPSPPTVAPAFNAEPPNTATPAASAAFVEIFNLPATGENPFMQNMLRSMRPYRFSLLAVARACPRGAALLEFFPESIRSNGPTYEDILSRLQSVELMAQFAYISARMNGQMGESQEQSATGGSNSELQSQAQGLSSTLLQVAQSSNDPEMVALANEDLQTACIHLQQQSLSSFQQIQ